MSLWDDDRDPKRTLGIRDKQILYDRAKGRCENPGCTRRKISFVEMQPGHKTAWSKGGRTTLANSVCLCYACNKKQGDDSWAVFLKKQGCEDPKTLEKQTIKKNLSDLTIKQLKYLADKHKVKIKGEVVESLLSSYTKAPTKAQYISKLAGIVTSKDLISASKLEAETPKKPTKKKTNDSWL
jgi:hypothetical protein